MAISVQSVRDLFERYGWICHQPDQQTLLVGFQGESNHFILGARLHDDWLTLTIPNYLPPIPPAKQAEVYQYLLGLNLSVVFVRFAIEPEDRITIIANLPTRKRLKYDLFAMAVDLITFYADDAYPRLYKLITGKEPSAQKEIQNER